MEGPGVCRRKLCSKQGWTRRPTLWRTLLSPRQACYTRPHLPATSSSFSQLWANSINSLVAAEERKDGRDCISKKTGWRRVQGEWILATDSSAFNWFSFIPPLPSLTLTFPKGLKTYFFAPVRLSSVSHQCQVSQLTATNQAWTGGQVWLAW